MGDTLSWATRNACGDNTLARNSAPGPEMRDTERERRSIWEMSDDARCCYSFEATALTAGLFVFLVLESSSGIWQLVTGKGDFHMPKHHHHHHQHHHHQHHHYWHTLTGKPAPPLKLPATLLPPPPTTTRTKPLDSETRSTGFESPANDSCAPFTGWWLVTLATPLIWRTSSELASPILSDFRSAPSTSSRQLSAPARAKLATL